jgi:type III pantothenate kinase
MVLCIDAGNSLAKICLFDETGDHGKIYREGLSDLGSSPESKLKSIVKDPKWIHGCIVSSVVPRFTLPICRAIEHFTKREPLVVSEHLRFPFRISVPDPGMIGTDRLCCAAGAIDKRRSSAILIDVGSAVTVDLIADAEFKGGIILAGPNLSLAALNQNTEQLPLLLFQPSTESSISRFDSTTASMLLGARMSTLGGIREAVRFLEKNVGRPPVKIFTGGAASAVLPSLPKSWRWEPDLIMKGLYRLWQINTLE